MFRKQLIEDAKIAYELLRRQAAADLLSFILFTKRDYQTNWHHKVICKYLNKILTGEIKRLMLFVPPQHGKTEIASRRFPAFCLGINPNMKILAATHTDTLAKDIGRQVQRIIDDDKYRQVFPATRLNTKNVKTDSFYNYIRTSNQFEIVDKEGSYNITSIGSGISGKTADLLIIDDPYKTFAEAQSIAGRKAVWDFYTGDLSNRVRNENVPIILIQTRWHKQDLAGKLLETEPEKWKVIRFPAIKEEPSPDDNKSYFISTQYDKRKTGEALWADNYSISYLNDKKALDGTHKFNSIHQQRPTLLEGQLFKVQNFRYYKIDDSGLYYEFQLDNEETKRFPIDSCTRVGFMDLATKKSESADFTTLGIFDITPENDILIVQMIRERFEGTEHSRVLRHGFNIYNPTLIGIESVQYQLNLIQQMSNEGFPVIEIKAKGSKEQRALSASARYEAGKIRHPSNVNSNNNWLITLETELLDFPNAEHDDQVDVISYCSIWNTPDANKILKPGIITTGSYNNGNGHNKNNGNGYSKTANKLSQQLKGLI